MSVMHAEDEALIDGLLKFVDRAIMPIQAEIQPLIDNPRLYYDESGREVTAVTDARRRARMVSAEAGYYTMFCPRQFGGQDLGIRLWYLCWEAMFHRYGAPPHQLPYSILSHFTSGPHEVWEYASDELRAELLPDLSSGKLQGCFGLSEPDAGSDSWAMKTTARRNGGDWIINGTKQWTSWSPSADFVMVYAVTDPEMLKAHKGGITCFYVPTDWPGYKLESVIKLWGSVGGEEGILSFTEVRVPDRFRVGEVDQGFKLAMLGVRHGRLANAGRTLGQARWALEKAIDYAKVRRTFGKTLAEHDTIRNYLAESAIQLYAARMMALDCAAKCDTDRDVRGEISMLKVFSTRTAFDVVNTAMQILGGMGLANETHLVDAFFQARITWVTEGSNEMQLRTIARSLLEGGFMLDFQ